MWWMNWHTRMSQWKKNEVRKKRIIKMCENKWKSKKASNWACWWYFWPIYRSIVDTLQIYLIHIGSTTTMTKEISESDAQLCAQHQCTAYLNVRNIFNWKLSNRIVNRLRRNQIWKLKMLTEHQFTIIHTDAEPQSTLWPTNFQFYCFLMRIFSLAALLHDQVDRRINIENRIN